MVYEKIEQQRFDPVDGKYYNLLLDKDIAEEVLERLVQQSEHSHPNVKKRLQEYQNFMATVENEYRNLLVRVNAEEEPGKVFINLCDAMEHIV